MWCAPIARFCNRNRTKKQTSYQIDSFIASFSREKAAQHLILCSFFRSFQNESIFMSQFLHRHKLNFDPFSFSSIDLIRTMKPKSLLSFYPLEWRIRSWCNHSRLWLRCEIKTEREQKTTLSIVECEWRKKLLFTGTVLNAGFHLVTSAICHIHGMAHKSCGKMSLPTVVQQHRMSN